MVEHVGEERIDEYATKLAGLLREEGRLLNHGIAKLKDLDTPDEGAFSERFVFPDGVPLPLSRIELALERAGLVTTHVEGLADDYAETLRHWIERYEDRYEDAVRLAGVERARIWRLYLRAARQGFQTGWASIYQVLDPPALTRRPQVAVLAQLNPTRGDRRGLHDRCGRLTERSELIDDFLQMADRTNVGLDQVAVLTGDPVALHHLRCVPHHLGNLVELARRGTHTDDRAEGVAERRRVEFGAVSTNDVLLLEALEALGDGGWGEPHATTELGQAETRVCLELTQESAVGFV